MRNAYKLAYSEIYKAAKSGGNILDCGAGAGQSYDILSRQIKFDKTTYFGIERDESSAKIGRTNGLNIITNDLNKRIHFEDQHFDCIFALSVLEHLLYPCRFLKESVRTLKPNGKLVLLTPNISTYFTIALLITGKMPSSGPHPDSDELIKKEEVIKVSRDDFKTDADADEPMHRHLIVFSFRVMRTYLSMIGFKNVQGYGFGLYPFPNFTQPLLEKLDPYHCHQMVFIATK